MKRFSTAMSVLVILCGTSQAQVSKDDIGRKLVNDFMENVVTLDGRFEQSLIDAEGGLVERTSGTLEIERPSRFRWAYEDPYEQWLVADGMNIWSYDLDLEQVTVKPQQDALANTPALLLGGSSEALEQFEFAGTTIETVATWVRLEPKNTESGFHRVELGFVDGQLSRMIFFDNLQQKTFVGLYDVKINEPIDETRFQFSVPGDVDLVGTPAVASNTSP